MSMIHHSLPFNPSIKRSLVNEFQSDMNKLKCRVVIFFKMLDNIEKKNEQYINKCKEDFCFI